MDRVGASGFGVRFFAFFSFPLPEAPFFLTLVTLIASGVLGRGSSASRSYAGKRDGGAGAAALTPASTRGGVAERDLLPFPYAAEDARARCGCGDTGAGVAAGTAPSGISPVLSMTNVWAGGAGVPRRLGRRAVGGAAVHTYATRINDNKALKRRTLRR